MGEIAILARRHLTSALRARAARIVALVYIVSVLAAIWVPSGETVAGRTLVLFAFVALTMLVYSVASGVGNGLPADRRSGRVEWLRTTAPPAWKHRAALVVAGWILAVLAGLCGGLVAAVATTMAAPEFTLRASIDVPLPDDGSMLVRRPAAGAETGTPLTLVLPAVEREGGTLELDLRPQFENANRLIDFADLDWRTDTGASGSTRVSVWRAMRLDLPVGTREVTLVNHTPHVHVRVRNARLLDRADASVFLLIVGAGLLLGFMAGAAAPVGVVISRFTSGTTASAAAFVVLLYGTLEGSLMSLVEGVAVEGAARQALALLTVTGWAAPDLPTVALIAEYANGRTPGFAVGSWLPALLGYTAAGAVLASIPLPSAWTERRLST